MRELGQSIMPLNESEVSSIQRFKLPAVELLSKVHRCLVVKHIAVDSVDMHPVQASVLRTWNGKVQRLQLSFSDGSTMVVVTKAEIDLFAAHDRELEVKNLKLDEDSLTLGSISRWKKHPKLIPNDLVSYQAAIRQSWTNGLRFVEEKRAQSGEILKKGLRSPQIGALHSLAAHWTVSKAPALVVMPTGTGKTEVMLASMIMRSANRLLVLVPSDALRQQTANKFLSLGILSETPVLSKNVLRPLVGTLVKRPTDNSILAPLGGCNVVVSTVAMLEGMESSMLGSFLSAFDTVYFDEAHHLPASSWERINERLSKHVVVQFTATPFRLDGKRIQSRIVYQFPLRLAQEQDYFRPIKFIEVNELDPVLSDESIAEKAVAQLLEDQNKGYAHILMARASTRDRADQLFRDIYEKKYSHLSPVLIYTGTPDRRNKLLNVRGGKHRIVVCVDMFGEGFDLPQLKIAAMHDVHSSLGITLQFTGRFTRAANGLGAATLVANISDPRVNEAIEELYAEDADWNKLIPELSARAIQSELDFGEFLSRMESETVDDDALFDLNILHPKTSTVIYNAPKFTPKNFRRGVKSGAHIKRVWNSKERDLLVFITRSRPTIEWARTKDPCDQVWDLYIAAYDSVKKLLFIHSSQKGTEHGLLARALGGDDAQIISGESMYRAFHGVNRMIFHNVGLRGRGKLRFRMFTGLDVAEVISPTAQSGNTKSNLFGVGYENGCKVTIGASFKGRVWSMAKGTIPEWRAWCQRIGTKILNESIRTNGFLQHTLLPVDILELPDIDLFVVLQPDEWLSLDEDWAQLRFNGIDYPVCAAEITDGVKLDSRTVVFSLKLGAQGTAVFEIAWGQSKGQYRVVQKSGATVFIKSKQTERPLSDFFAENIPVILLMDGSEVRGGHHFQRREEIPWTFDRDSIQAVDWQSSGVTIKRESKWKNGTLRSDSVQGELIKMRTSMNNSFVIDDDDSGEAADVVEIFEQGQEIVFRLFHCKFSSEDKPGARVGDLYQVCGQAVRSARLVDNPKGLIEHLERREHPSLLNGRPTRLEKGTLKELSALRRRLPRLKSRFEITVVQPGLSKAKIDAEIATILGAADNYVREFTGGALQVMGSP